MCKTNTQHSSQRTKYSMKECAEGVRENNRWWWAPLQLLVPLEINFFYCKNHSVDSIFRQWNNMSVPGGTAIKYWTLQCCQNVLDCCSDISFWCVMTTFTFLLHDSNKPWHRSTNTWNWCVYQCILRASAPENLVHTTCLIV